MELNLKYPPTSENAPRFADEIVEAAAEINSIALNFVPISLSDVDGIIDEMREDGVTLEQVAETLFAFGCYVGEVLVRNAGGRWRDRDDTALAPCGGMPIVVELADQATCDPIGKAFKRFKNGSVDSLLHFYTVFTEPPSPK